MIVGWATDVGLVRDHNEDACFAGDGCLVVADGMGGHRAGEVAAELAVRSVASAYQSNPGSADVRECILQANLEVMGLAATSPALQGMGTTLTVAFIRGPSLVVGHVGDSRAYVIRDGSITQLTRDHSVVGELLRCGALTENEAKIHPQRHAITRALGFTEDLDVDTASFDLVGGDVVVLCTDGLHNLVEPDEIAGSLAPDRHPQSACASLVELARSRGGYDNVTVVAARVDQADLLEVKSMVHMAGDLPGIEACGDLGIE
ncbi:MAG: Stp1/IreP family PP2C-type Ser/Thr phosphatase [Firmicutes bacterium]|jgi:protein phosphatase|nr:Stp1/IreP family PP2C-type Ser/Thr phosphatase [Bacillota bacterium]